MRNVSNNTLKTQSTSGVNGGPLSANYRKTSLQKQSVNIPQPSIKKTTNKIHVLQLATDDVPQPKMAKGGSGNFQNQNLNNSKVPQIGRGK